MPLTRAHRPSVVAAAIAAAIASSAFAHAQDKDACASAAEEAQRQRDAGKLKSARASLVSCAQESCPAIVREDCKRWLTDVDAKLPTVLLKARAPDGRDLVDVRVTIDGEELTPRLDGTARAVDPGVHQLTFTAAGMAPVTERVVVAEGEKGRAISVVLGSAGHTAPGSQAAPPERPDTEHGSSIGPWVLLGVGLAGGAAFGVLQIVAHTELADLDEPGGCRATRTCTDEELDPIRTKLVASAVSLGIGGAALLGAGAWWLLDRPSNTTAARDGKRHIIVLARPDPTQPWLGAAGIW